MRRETPSMSPRLADTAVRDTECEPHWDSKSETTDTEDDHVLRTLNMERTKVEAGSGISLSVRVFRPDGNVCRKDLTMVLVHQYSVLGGCQALLRGMACRLSAKGFTTITFDMRGVGESTGKPSLTGTSEVQDVVAVCQWAAQHCSALSIVLVGSSAGAPIAGAAIDAVKEIVGYVSLGYPFGTLSSVLFGRHNKVCLQSQKPKLFIMGTNDGFTSVRQLENKLKSAAGRVEKRLVRGAGHFEMEGPQYDEHMVDYITTFADSLSGSAGKSTLPSGSS